MTDNKWAQPIAVSPVDAAFPASVTGKYLPPIEDVPDEFKRHEGTKWNIFVNNMFFHGWDGVNPSLVTRKGVDAQVGFDQVQACLRSFEPKHEHKEAGVAYLLSLFFEDIVDPKDLEV